MDDIAALKAGLLADIERTEFAAREAVSPLQRLEDGLHPWVAFVIMPLFAFANAGVLLSPSSLREPVAVAAAAGLVIGKPVGILLLCGLAVRARLTSLPDGVTWGMFTGGVCGWDRFHDGLVPQCAGVSCRPISGRGSRRQDWHARWFNRKRGTGQCGAGIRLEAVTATRVVANTRSENVA